MKKARGDSKLKTLPPAVQAELFAQCQGKGGYATAAEWLLGEHGVKTSAGSLSNFYGWYPFSLSRTASYAQQFEAEIAKLPDMAGKAAQLSQIGQVGFEMLAMQSNDLEGYATLKKLRLKEHQQSLTERRVALLEKAAAQAEEAKAVTDNAELSDAEKLARYKAIFGS
jgi:hypothetical protein